MVQPHGAGRSGPIAGTEQGRSLAQGPAEPKPTALAATILSQRKAYYDALEAANKRNELAACLCWFAAAAIEAQQRTTARVEFLIAKTRLLDRLRRQLNGRQEKALLRMLREGPEGFSGGLSAGNYVRSKGQGSAAMRAIA